MLSKTCTSYCMIEHVTALAKESAVRRNTEKVNVTAWVQSKDDLEKFVRPYSSDASPKSREKMVTTFTREIDPVRRVALLSKHYRPRYDEHPSAVGAIRDLAWLRIVEGFRDALERDQRLIPSNLDSWARDHPLMQRVKDWKHEYWTFKVTGD